jgi:DNA-binding transcriptional LysR family regulator
MNYTLHQLQVFLKVAQLQSITKAANDLHLSQPAVSIQLKNLQDQFEIPLTEVVGRKLYVTHFGKEIAKVAQEILNQVEEINSKTLAYKGHLTGRLKISVVSTGKYVMPYFLSDFLKEYPAIELSLDVTNKARVLEDLEKNEVDFSLVSVLPLHLQIEKIELLQNKLFLIGNQDFKFKKTVYDKKLFETLPIIYREQGSGTRYVMENFIQKNKLPIIKKMELTSNEAVKQAVIAGLGFSIMPLIGIKHELLNGELQIIPVKGFPIKSIWNLIWMKGKNPSPVAKAFLAHLKSEKARITKEKFAWYEEY